MRGVVAEALVLLVLAVAEFDHPRRDDDLAAIRRARRGEGMRARARAPAGFELNVSSSTIAPDGAVAVSRRCEATGARLEPGDDVVGRYAERAGGGDGAGDVGRRRRQLGTRPDQFAAS